MSTTALELFYKIRDSCKALEAQHNEASNETRGLVPQGWCGPAWDGIMCWQGAPPNTLVSAPCPQYFRFSPHKNATKFCTENGNWLVHEERNKTWTNFTECMQVPFEENAASLDITFPNSNTDLQLYQIWVPRIKLIQHIGYSLSIILLLSALIIFTRFKRLRCPRNTLHVNVFISFFLKAAMFVVKVFILVDGTAMKADMVTDQSGGTYVKEHNSWICKAYTSFGQYVIVTNYTLLLMEGVYLYRLLFSVCPDYSVKHILLFGWLSPFLSVVPWALTKAYYHNELCWTTHGNLPYQLIIHVPIVLATLTNFVLFVQIVRVLAAKLHMPGHNRYGRLIRGTLVLMPLFGVPYTVSIATWYPASRNPIHELAWVVFDQTFTSMQGACVALFYCLLSSDVRNELRRVLCKRRPRRFAVMRLDDSRSKVRRSTN